MNNRKNRDEFDRRIASNLAKRASYICSNPDCRALTLSPSETNSEGHIYVGKAAHITAAAPKGPRYDPTLTPKQRSSIENGIFLCAVCADMIDKNNGMDFPMNRLMKWKSDHEAWVRNNLNKSINSLLADPRIPEPDIVFDCGSQYMHILKSSETEMYEKDIKAELGIRIIRLDLQIINKGTAPANDIDVVLEFDGKPYIHTEKDLRSHWEIYPRNLFDNPEEFMGSIFRRRTVPAIERLHTDVLNIFSYSIFEGVIGSHRVLPKNSLSKPTPVSVNGRRVAFQIKKLKQNLSQTIESFYVEFPSWEEMDSFSIDYFLNAEELSSDVTGNLTVNIQKEIGNAPLKKTKQKKHKP